MEHPFVASDILRTLGEKTPIAKIYVLSRPIPLKSRFFGTQYVSPPLMDRNPQLFSSYHNFRFCHSPTLPLIRNRQLSIFIDFLGFIFRYLVLALYLYLYLALYRYLRTSSECQLERLKILNQGCLEQKRSIEFLSFER